MYPLSYQADYVRERNRLTTFFRLILAIPWYIVNYIYTFAAEVVAVIAWFALLILGRYPDWAYEFNSGVLRYSTRFNAWLALQTDQFPPFGIGPDPTYPVRLQVAPRAEKQSRLKALFRIILAIPLMVLSFAMILLHFAAAHIAWLTIVFRGYQPAGVHNALAFTNAWNARYVGYLLLLRDEFPPVGDEPVQVGDVPAAGQPALGGSAAGQ
ncbi:MAG: DUF4389 domain-containing protein [Actinomycetota bacterium]|jgi:hypothetical protein|nr:DUF4389 domain-containing protein [Actinomycetota bacterium]